MLWVNLIMDTFAAIAPSTLPPDKRVMSDKPRNPKSHFQFTHSRTHLSGYELGEFFTTFVLLQFWNIFNARYFRTGRSFTANVVMSFTKPKTAKDRFSLGFLLIVAVILPGQFVIVNLADEFFDVSPIPMHDCGTLLLFTLPVLLVPDVFRLVRSFFRR